MLKSMKWLIICTIWLMGLFGLWSVISPPSLALFGVVNLTPTPPIRQTPTGNQLVYLPMIIRSTEAESTPTVTATAPTSGTPFPPGPVTLVTLGDSLTEGDGDDSPEMGGYPRRLLTQLQTVRPNSTLNNLGKSGWTSNDLINTQLTPAVNLLNQASGAKVALVWIGSNDLWGLYEYGPEPMTSQAEAEDLQNYTNNLETIVSQLRATGAQVYIALGDDQSKRPCVANPNPTEPTFPATTAQDLALMSIQINRYNQAIQAKATQHGATTVDFYHTDIFVNPVTLAGDGNHPNAAGYDLITTIWFNALRPALGN